MAKVTPRIQAGFMELLPAEQILFDKIKNALAKDWFRP